MNRQFLNILLSAFAVAAIASYFVYRLVTQQIGSGRNKQTVTVVEAAHDLEVGAMIKASDLRTGEVVGGAPRGALFKLENALGRGVLVPIFTGEPVIEQRLAQVGSGAGLAAIIPKGMRACAVRVDDVVGVAGFASPGMRVDVLISGKLPGKEAESGTKVKTLLQNVEVLSAGKNFKQDKDGSSPAEATVVNLLVTPEQAEILSLASSNETRIQLVLRNPLDREIGTPPGSTVANLFGDPSKAPMVVASAPVRHRPVVQATPTKQVDVPPPPPPVHKIQVMNGPKSTEQTFDKQGARQ
jgi:pilus assembly protein CpaB